MLLDGEVKCICETSWTGKCCDKQNCKLTTKPPPAGDCKNGGVKMGSKCACPAWYEGAKCEKSTTPQVTYGTLS